MSGLGPEVSRIAERRFGLPMANFQQWAKSGQIQAGPPPTPCAPMARKASVGRKNSGDFLHGAIEIHQQPLDFQFRIGFVNGHHQLPQKLAVDARFHLQVF